MDVYCVPVEAIEPIWNRVEGFFAKALGKHDAEFSLSDLKDLLLKNQWKLFAFVNDDNILNGAAVVVYSVSKISCSFCNLYWRESFSESKIL